MNGDCVYDTEAQAIAAGKRIFSSRAGGFTITRLDNPYGPRFEIYTQSYLERYEPHLHEVVSRWQRTGPRTMWKKATP